jgi:hypothetical protein
MFKERPLSKTEDLQLRLIPRGIKKVIDITLSGSAGKTNRYPQPTSTKTSHLNFDTFEAVIVFILVYVTANFLTTIENRS